jgi:hypothetical protein
MKEFPMTSLTLTETASFPAASAPRFTLQTVELAKDGYAQDGISGASWMALLGFGVDMMRVARLPFTAMMRLGSWLKK